MCVNHDYKSLKVPWARLLSHVVPTVRLSPGDWPALRSDSKFVGTCPVLLSMMRYSKRENATSKGSLCDFCFQIWRYGEEETESFMHVCLIQL